MDSKTISRFFDDSKNKDDVAKLLEICEDVLRTFNPLACTLDSHAAEKLGNNISACQSKLFVKQVLYGCVRYKEALKALITSFYYNNSATTSRGDYTKYVILSYLAIYRLEEMGFPTFSRIVKSQPAEKMHVFLSYVFDVPTLEKWVKDTWITFYDLTYVEHTMIGMIQKFSPQVLQLCADLSSAAFGITQQVQEEDRDAGIPNILSKPPTVVKPFNLTPARPVRVPEPMKIKQEVVANPMPKHLNRRTLQGIEKERKQLRARVFEETLKKYETSQEFSLSDTRDTLTRAVEQKELEIQSILDKKFRAKPVPDFESKAAVVKMNASTILKEDALYKKKQLQEAKLLEAYEQELRDSTEFYAWQSRKRVEDETRKKMLVEKRRTDSTASQIEARLASQRRVRENKRVAVEMKVKRVDNQIEKHRETEKIVQRKRELANCIKARKDRPIIEKEKIKKRNHQAMKEIREKQKKLEIEKRREEEAEQTRRNDLIRRIRALEKVPTVKVKEFDRSSTGGHGLLEEMSLIELKERLAINEIKYEKEKVELKNKILQNKAEKEEAMQQRMIAIRRAREVTARANRQARKQSKDRDAERQRLEQEIKDEAKIKLVDKLARIRQEREDEIHKLQLEEERLHKRNLFLGAAKDMVEEKVHQEFLKGAERKVRTTQKALQNDARACEAIKKREEAIRVANRKRDARLQKKRERVAHARFEESQKKTKEKVYAEVKEKRITVRKEQERYKQTREKLAGINAYATSLNQIPIQIIQSMDRQQLGVFYSGKPRDVKKAIDALFDGEMTLDRERPTSPTNIGSIPEALDAIHEYFHR